MSLSFIVYFYPNMQNIPYPLALLIVFRKIKLLILLGPSSTKLQFKLLRSSFFSTKAEQLLLIWTAFPKVLLILFIKICGLALLITLTPYLLLKLNSLFQIWEKFNDPYTNTPPSPFSLMVLNLSIGLQSNPPLDFKCTP